MQIKSYFPEITVHGLAIHNTMHVRLLLEFEAAVRAFRRMDGTSFLLELQRQWPNYWISAIPESHMKHYNTSGNNGHFRLYRAYYRLFIMYIGTPDPLS